MAVLSAIEAVVRPRLLSTRGAAVASALLVGLCLARLAAAVDARQPEDRVKAAFLFNFAHFIKWPAEAVAGADALIIAVLRDDDFGDEVARTVAGKTVAGRALEVRAVDAVADLAPCQVAFIGAAAAGDVDAILTALADRHVLTVSEVDGFANRGGVIGLYKSDNKLRFRINIAAARRAGLEISSKLLDLAEIVEGPVAGGTR
jgi:hypothetical protein